LERRLSVLKGVISGKVKKPARITLYGPPKIGKSTFASEAPNPIFVQTQDAGIDNISVDKFAIARSWEDILANIEEVLNGKHEYKTLVLDTLNGTATLASQFVCNTVFGGDWGPKGYAAYGQGITRTVIEIGKLVNLLDLCHDKGMGVIILAHTGLHAVKNPVEGDFQKYAPDVDRKIWGRLFGWPDVIMRADFLYTVIKSDNPKAKGRAIGTSTRVLHCSGTAAEDAGTRAGFELPETLPLSWQAFSDALGNDTATLTEVLELWPLLTPDQQQKSMAWLGVKKLEDAYVSKLRELLNRLRQIKADTQPVENEKEAANA
jgi:hypothetical protein